MKKKTIIGSTAGAALALITVLVAQSLTAGAVVKAETPNSLVAALDGALQREIKACMGAKGHAYSIAPSQERVMRAAKGSVVDRLLASVKGVPESTGKRANTPDESFDQALWSPGGCADTAYEATYGAAAAAVPEEEATSYEQALDAAATQVAKDPTVRRLGDERLACMVKRVPELSGSEDVESVISRDLAKAMGLPDEAMAQDAPFVEEANLNPTEADLAPVRELEAKLAAADSECGAEFRAAKAVAEKKADQEVLRDHPRVVAELKRIAGVE